MGGQFPERPAIQGHEITGILELRFLEKHPERERCGYLMLAQLGVWAIAVNIGHYAVTNSKIDTIPFGPFHIGSADTVLNAEVTDAAFRAVIDGPFCNGGGDVLAVFDVVDADGV